MAVNDSRSMIADFHQGVIDKTYMQLCPDRGNIENPPLARMEWPTYDQVEQHEDPPFIEAHMRRVMLPRERRGAEELGEPRY